FLRNDNQAQIVKENFIPVALDLQVESTRKDAVGDFFRQINKVQQGGIPYFTGASGRIHAMTADGEFFNCQGNPWRDCDDRAAVRPWNKLPESKRKTGTTESAELVKVDPKVPTPPAGGLILQVYESRLAGDLKGELRRRDKAETFGWGVYEPGRDSVWLRQAEWQPLAATDRTKGAPFPPPAPVAERMLARLTDWSEANAAHWRLPQHVRHQDLTLTVEAISDAALRLRLEGSVRLAQESPKEGVRYHPALQPLHHTDPKAFAR